MSYSELLYDVPKNYMNIRVNSIKVDDSIISAGGFVNGIASGEITLTGTATHVVPLPTISATDIVLLTMKTPGGTLTDFGYTIQAGVSFTITTVTANTSVLSYVVLVPSTKNGNATLPAPGGGNNNEIDIADVNITANSIILLTLKTVSANLGVISYTLDPGVGFTISSSDDQDDSVISYAVVKY